MAVRLADVAAALGLDGSTVSRALRDDPRVQAETRLRVKAAALKLGYQPHVGARALAEGRSRTYWFLLPELDTPVTREPAAWASRYLLERGYDLLLAQHHNDPAVYARLLARLSSGLADGALVIPPPSGDLPELRVLEGGLPLVFVDRHVPAVPAPLVTTDNARAVADALGSLGRVAWVFDGFEPAANPVEAERSRGLREAAERLGVVLYDRGADASSLAGLSGGALFATGQHGALSLAEGLGAATAVVFDDWTGPAWPFERALVLVQDFRRLGEAAAAALLGDSVPRVQAFAPLRTLSIGSR